MRILLACDKFKGSLSAADASAAIAAGLLRADPAHDVVIVPVADGGDGTLDAAYAAGFERVPCTVTGPTGSPVRTSFGRRGDLAVVELADACGLARLPDGRPAPLTASSRGLGEVLNAALATAATHIIIGVGGSASTDGGMGMLAALGVAFRDAAGRPVPEGGGALAAIAAIDLTGLPPRTRDVDWVLASDVTNPLLGEHGCAHVFAPQKGADPEQVAVLEAGLAAYARLLVEATGRDLRAATGAGAAGGVGFAALTVLRARRRPGVDVVLDWSHFATALTTADLVITGEGCLDRQTLLGKAPAGIADAARAAGVPVIAICGRNELTRADLATLGISRAYALADLEPDPARSLAQAPRLLTVLGEEVGRGWAAR